LACSKRISSKRENERGVRIRTIQTSILNKLHDTGGATVFFSTWYLNSRTVNRGNKLIMTSGE